MHMRITSAVSYPVYVVSSMVPPIALHAVCALYVKVSFQFYVKTLAEVFTRTFFTGFRLSLVFVVTLYLLDQSAPYYHRLDIACYKVVTNKYKHSCQLLHSRFSGYSHDQFTFLVFSNQT